MIRSRLLHKYLIAGSLVALGCVTLTALLGYLVYRDALHDLVATSVAVNQDALGDRLTQHATALGDILAGRLARPLDRGDEAAIADLLDSARRLSGALLIVLRDPSGQRIAWRGNLDLDPGSTAGSSASVAGDHVATLTPVTRKGVTVGQLVQVFDASALLRTNAALAADLASIQREAELRGMLRIMGFGLMVLLAISALAAALAYRQLRIIRSLLASVARLAHGDYSTPLPVADGNEFGPLARAIDNLRVRLSETTISLKFLDRVLASMVDAIIISDTAGHITRVNLAACELLQCRETDLLGKPLTDIVAPSHRPRFTATPGQRRQGESVLLTRAGAEVPVSFSQSPITGADAPSPGTILSARNISERKAAEQRIRYLARIDALTKIPNRMQFQHLLQRAIAKAQRSRQPLALLYLDVDRFKDINDTFGHAAGDTSLETLTHRAGKLLPDGAFMGRLAGDEFGILLEISEPPDARQAWLQSISRRLLRELSQVFIAQGQELYITASIGIAQYPADADNVLDLIRNADAALYHAKRAGGNRFEFYTPDMNAAAVEKLILKSKLRRSYELDELLLNYQPKIRLDTGEVMGAEALVRWELSEHGLVLPSQFIPLAEETNLILEIGEWVLNRVCEDYKAWRQVVADPGRISVNLSLKQLAQPKFVRRIGRIFRRHGISPEWLELEITESTLMQDPQRTINVLNELHDMGLHLAIDDFGTGYSSLSALQQFPIRTLKIDQSFVRDAAEDADNATIVAAIVDMAHSLKMAAVAEGVESEAQLGFLRTVGCDYAQGLLFGEPMSAAAYLELVREQQAGQSSYRALFG